MKTKEEYKELALTHMCLFNSAPSSAAPDTAYVDWQKKMADYNYYLDRRGVFFYSLDEENYIKNYTLLHIKAHIALNNPAQDLIFVRNIVHDIMEEKNKQNPVVLMYKMISPLLINFLSERSLHQITMTIYFYKAANIRHIADFIHTVESSLTQFSEIVPGRVAASDYQVGQFCRITIDKNAKGEYINGSSSHQERQNLMNTDPKFAKLKTIFVTNIKQLRSEEQNKKLFVQAYWADYHSTFFHNPYSAMKTLLSNPDLSFADIQDYVKANPNTRSARIFNSLQF